MLSVALVLTFVAAVSTLVLMLNKVAALTSALAKLSDFIFLIVEVDGSNFRLGLGGGQVTVNRFLGLVEIFLLLEFDSLTAASVSSLAVVSALSTAEAMALLRVGLVGASLSLAFLGFVGLKELLELSHLEALLDGKSPNLSHRNVL